MTLPRSSVCSAQGLDSSKSDGDKLLVGLEDATEMVPRVRGDLKLSRLGNLVLWLAGLFLPGRLTGFGLA